MITHATLTRTLSVNHDKRFSDFRPMIGHAAKPPVVVWSWAKGPCGRLSWRWQGLGSEQASIRQKATARQARHQGVIANTVPQPFGSFPDTQDPLPPYCVTPYSVPFTLSRLPEG